MIKGTETLPVGDLISRRVPFVIPSYQRAYAWEEDEVSDFIEDIRTLYNIRQKTPSEIVKHFFGGLVSVDLFATNSAGRIYEVVDGQQRLATFIITIALIVRAIDNLASKANQDNDLATEQQVKAHYEQTRRSFLHYDEIENGNLQQRLRLTLSKVDRIFFEQMINETSVAKPKPDSHKRLKKSFDKINKELIKPILDEEKLSIQEKLLCLLSLKSCVTDDCYVLHIVSDDRNETYRLFAVLNDRGKTLSDGELLRSRTLELLEGHLILQNGVESYWDEILSGTPSQISDFLVSYFPSHVGERAAKRDIFDDYCKKFFNYSTSCLKSESEAKSVEQRVANMRDEYNTFSKIREGEWVYENPTVCDWDRQRLYRLVKILKHTLCFPLLISIHTCLSEDIFSETVNLLERFVFRYITVVGARADSLSDIYHEHATEIRQNPKKYKLAKLEDDLSKLAAEKAPDSVFQVNLIEKLRYSDDSTRKRLVKHFLTTLEDYHSWFSNGATGKPKPSKISTYDINQLSIEHIYPQKAKVKIPLLEAYINNIGNLSFWAPGENREASNDVFEIKKPLYQKSSIRMNRELTSIAEWNEQQFKNREEKFVKMALKLFAF